MGQTGKLFVSESSVFKKERSLSGWFYVQKGWLLAQRGSERVLHGCFWAIQTWILGKRLALSQI